MKRHNVNMNKPSLERLDHALDRRKLNKQDKRLYVMECQNCGHKWQFHIKDICPDGVIHCDNCGFEEVFFATNFHWVDLPATPENIDKAFKENL